MAHTTSDWGEEIMDRGFTQEEKELIFDKMLENNHFSNDIDGAIINAADDVIESIEMDIADIEKSVSNASDDLFDISGSFQGLTEIKEYDDSSMFIPSMYFCGIKCLEKYFGKKLKHTSLGRTSTISALMKCLIDENGIDKNLIPRVVRQDRGKKGKNARDPLDTWERTDSHHSSTADACLGLIYFKGTSYHAVLLKTAKYNTIPPSKVFANMVINQNTTLTDEQVKLLPVRPKAFRSKCFVYDMETFVTNKVRKDGKLNSMDLIPYGIAYRMVNLDEPDVKTPSTVSLEKDKNEKMAEGKGENGGEQGVGGGVRLPPIHLFRGLDCLEQFVESIRQYATGDDELVFFAHNGGCFDTVLMKRVKGVKFSDQLKSGRIKSLLMTIPARNIEPEITVKFLDSLSFTQMSLDESAKAFGTLRKLEFNIEAKSVEWFEENKEWENYLRVDVECLAQVVKKMSDSLRFFGECITQNTGIASVAWRVMMKGCYHMDKLFLVKSPVVRRFIRDACYGGRILHWKRNFVSSMMTGGLVSLDGNSLYPSAMVLGLYPTGKYTVLTAEYLTVARFTQHIKNGYLAIAEVVLDAGNVRYPLIPFRTDNRELIYPAGEFTGVYTSVDILEALSMGYVLKSVKRGITWSQAKRIFERLITSLFEQRKDYKKAENPLEYTMKIMYNSMYGKMLESIRSVSHFLTPGKHPNKRQKVVGKTTLINGQTEFNTILPTPTEKKPTYLGAFILSYARAIMNKAILMIGPEYVFYGDTDSVYVPRKRLEECKFQFSDELGGFKNDYGNGAEIDIAYFLDLKRYFLKFNKPVKDKDKMVIFKAKYNGLNFKKDFTLRNWCCGGLDKEEGTRKLYEWFHNNPNTTLGDEKTKDLAIVQEKWSRVTAGVIIAHCEMKYQISPFKRGAWKGDEFYPIGYNHDLKERKYPVTYSCVTDSTMLIHTDDFDLTPHNFRTALPLGGWDNKTCAVACDKLPTNMKSAFTSAIVGTHDGGVFYSTWEPKKSESGKWEEKTEGDKKIIVKERVYYEFGQFGPTKPRPDIKEYDKIVFSIPHANTSAQKNPSQMLSPFESKKFMEKFRNLVANWKEGKYAE